MSKKVNWKEATRLLLKKYKGRKHPLDYGNTYQLLVCVILSAQDSDKHINQISPRFFAAFPNLESLYGVTPESLFQYIGDVRNFGNKAKWIVGIAQQLKSDKNIPKTMDELTALPGIGRKSANVIMRELGIIAEGVIVDLHVVRVAPRIGIAMGTDPKKIEQQIMNEIAHEDWGEIGMAISFLGREICRPTNPKCFECPMNEVCIYYRSML